MTSFAVLFFLLQCTNHFSWVTIYNLCNIALFISFTNQFATQIHNILWHHMIEFVVVSVIQMQAFVLLSTSYIIIYVILLCSFHSQINLLRKSHHKSWSHRLNKHQFCLKMTLSLSDKTSDNMANIFFMLFCFQQTICLVHKKHKFLGH